MRFFTVLKDANTANQKIMCLTKILLKNEEQMKTEILRQKLKKYLQQVCSTENNKENIFIMKTMLAKHG